MQILLTNDDGILAPGIRALHSALEGLGEITVVAPLTVQSATSHGVTFHKPMMANEVAMDDGSRGVAVDGRPADCVKIALTSIWPEIHGEGTRPDLTISGMNSGANVGINVIYSGTVGAAVESAFLGVPSIAVSLQRGNQPETCWQRAAQIARAGIDRVLHDPGADLLGNREVRRPGEKAREVRPELVQQRLGDPRGLFWAELLVQT